MRTPLRVPPALLRRFVRSHRETVHLTRSRANVRRLRAAHSEIEAEIARSRRTGS